MTLPSFKSLCSIYNVIDELKKKQLSYTINKKKTHPWIFHVLLADELVLIVKDNLITKPQTLAQLLDVIIQPATTSKIQNHPPPNIKRTLAYQSLVHYIDTLCTRNLIDPAYRIRSSIYIYTPKSLTCNGDRRVGCA